jgi:hypothetical protein
MSEKPSGEEATAARVQGTPLGLGADCLDGMLNFEIHHDPNYSGLEIQVFDDESHGRGKLVFLSRAADGMTDVYHEPGLRVDPSGYAIGSGLGHWTETTFHPARVELAPNGVGVDLGMIDRAGRSIRLRVDDWTRRSRRTAPFLAPMGAAIQSPNRLPLVWMNRFDLVRSGGQFEATIDGDPVEIGRLPGSFLHRRRLVKYASDLFVVAVNPSYEGHLERAVLDDVTIESNGHRAHLTLDEATSLEDLGTDVEARGVWRLTIDGTDVVGGSWRAHRSGPQVRLDMEVDRGWHPHGLPPFMRLVTTVVPVFRRWPTTYRWRAVIDLDRLMMTSGWARTDTEGDGSYQRLTAAD